MIILPGLGVLRRIIALSISLSVTARSQPDFLLGKKENTGTQAEFGGMLDYRRGKEKEVARGVGKP